MGVRRTVAKGTKIAAHQVMFFNLMGSWIRGVIAIGLVVAGIVLVKEWADELPTHVRTRDVSSRAEVNVPLESFPERVAAWKPGLDRPTMLLGLGILAILLTLLGRLVSPLLWRRGDGEARGPGRDSKTHRLESPPWERLQICRARIGMWNRVGARHRTPAVAGAAS